MRHWSARLTSNIRKLLDHPRDAAAISNAQRILEQWDEYHREADVAVEALESRLPAEVAKRWEIEGYRRHTEDLDDAVPGMIAQAKGNGLVIVVLQRPMLGVKGLSAAAGIMEAALLQEAVQDKESTC